MDDLEITNERREPLFDQTAGQEAEIERQISVSDDASSCYSHQMPVDQFIYIGAWLGLLTLSFFWVRLWCLLGIPDDCHYHPSVTYFEDFKELMTLGFIICVMTGMHLPERFCYIFTFERRKPRGWAFLVLFFATGPIFGCLDFAPWFGGFSITASVVTEPSPAPTAMLVGIIALAVALVTWHFHFGWKQGSKHEFFTYAASRLCVWLYYAVYGVWCFRDGGFEFHLHHYFVAFLIALMAVFNHPVSLAVLACATSIFVQGLSVYEAAPLFFQKCGPATHSLKDSWL